MSKGKILVEQLPGVVHGLLNSEVSRDKYFVTTNGIEREVTAEGYIRAEESCGFFPKSGSGFATASFGSSEKGMSGRIKYA